jgi:hypothetical protein
MGSQQASEHVIYWHRDLPPVDAVPTAEGMLEATSCHVQGTLSHRDELWERCLVDLMAQARVRLEQELRRQHGHYAHVLSESIETKRDEASGDAWLHGTFGYVVLRRAGDQLTPGGLALLESNQA